VTVLRVENLSFRYGPRHLFTAWAMDFTAGLSWVQGGNGCGKSTLLQLLAGALLPQAGRIRVQTGPGQWVDQSAQALDYRRQVFWCGPGPVAFDHLSPREYLAFMRTLYPTLDEAALARHLSGFGLAGFLGAPLCTLSSGTQRKVWLAMALAAGTPFTLLDEPLNALDAASVAYLLAQLQALAQTPTRGLIVASHEALGPAGAQARVIALQR
jgi:ABC-type transport system involved in cytochrome c biogenesis ATPase subunit